MRFKRDSTRLAEKHRRRATPRFRFVCHVLVILACCTASFADPPKTKRWLGDQNNRTPLADPNLDGIQEIHLFVRDGGDLRLSDRSYIVSFVKRQVRRISRDSISLKRGKKYLVGLVIVPGTALYDLDLIVDGGTLDKSVVHIRDGRLPLVDDSITSIVECVYEIPDEIAVEEGELNFKVSRVFHKP